MLSLLLLLFGLSGLRTDYDRGQLGLQITVPEKIGSNAKEDFESQVFYKLLIEGKAYTVNLTQKNFLPHNFRVYGYNYSEIMQPLIQKFKNLCNYQGHIEGFPNSVVTISTCSGLRGLIQFENISYGIEPLETSAGFEHVIYPVKNKNTNYSLYTKMDNEPSQLSHKIPRVKYDHMGADTAAVTQKVFQVIGFVSAVFTSFNITLVLSSLELWIEDNRIPITGEVNELLYRFLNWKKSYLVLRPHDVAFLLAYREKSNYVGATLKGKMCDADDAGGVALYSRTISLESFAVIIAQLLSLSMGIAFDDIDKCQCSGAACIMNPEAVHSSGVKIFSSCSMEDFTRFISKPNSQCLQNQPHLDPSYKTSLCGNKRVEEGEQCDCGRVERCNNRRNCHCEDRYLPPDCLTISNTWPGGSVDSGNFPPNPREY
ncbi:disintegrin and metalloproteinase domain-containing protein 2-like [Dugong dugon]